MGAAPDWKPSTIGSRIQSLLEKLGHTAAWLADRAGVERSTVTRIIKGERAPTGDTLRLLAPALGLTFEQLVADTDAEGRSAEAAEFVSRAHFDDAIRQVVEYESAANRASLRVASLEDEVRQEIRKRREAEKRAEDAERARDQANANAARNEAEADKYKRALERAVAAIATLNTQVAELAKQVEAGRMEGRATKIFAGVAAAASIAAYLSSNGNSSPPSKKRRRGAARTRA
jgi:transcriptional regulator with XRE-family HTH domain